MEYPIDLAGGGQLSTQTLCEGILDYGKKEQSGYDFEPVVVCPMLLQKSVDDYSFPIVTYPSYENRELSKIKRIKNFFGRIRQFKKIIKEEKPDLIHVSMSESLISYGFLRCLGIFSKIPLVYTDRGLCYGYGKFSKACILKTMKHAKALITTTEFNKNLWDKEGIKCDIRVIPNTISASFDHYDESIRFAMRNQYGIKEEEFIIGFAGRISEEKDWPIVPKLIQALHDANLKFKVALVLSTYENRDQQIVESITKGITDVIGTDNLIYLCNLSQKEMSDYYYMLDTFVMTSSFESFGKAAVEAMSRKCVVVSTSVGGLTEVVGKTENFYDKENLETFVKKIMELSTDSSKLLEEREYFYHRYKSLYQKEINVLRHLDLYREYLKLDE